MGEASAVPGNLIKYSANNTGRADTLDKWISTVLAPALAAYRSGAVQFGADIAGVTAGSEPIDTAVQGALARAKLTDEQVRFTGIAFQEAGSQGAPMSLVSTVPFLPGKAPAPVARPGLINSVDWTNVVVHSDDQTLNKAAYQDGVWAAKQLSQYTDGPNGPDYKGFYAMIATRADDPAFSAGLLNTLSPNDLALLLHYQQYSTETGKYGQPIPPVSMAALWRSYASALASGQLTPKAEQIVVADLLKDDKGGDLTIPALQAVAANPAAAKAFVKSLDDGTLPAGTLQQLFASTAEQRVVLQVLTTDLRVNPADADRLFKTVSSLLIKYPEGESRAEAALLKVSSGDLAGIQPQLIEFLQAYIAGKLGPPPTDPAKLQAWSEGLGKNLRELAPFYHAIINTETQENLDYAKANEFAKGFLITILLAGPVEVFGPEEGAGFIGYEGEGALSFLDKKLTQYAFGGIAGGTVYQVEPPVTKLLFGEGEPKQPSSEMQRVLRNYAALYMAEQLFKKGMIVDARGRPITWNHATDGGGLDGLVKKLGPDPSTSRWAETLHFRDPAGGMPDKYLNLQYVINSVLGVESN